MNRLPKRDNTIKKAVVTTAVWGLALLLPILPVFSASVLRGERAVITRVQDNRKETRYITGTNLGNTTNVQGTSNEDVVEDLVIEEQERHISEFKQPLPEALFVEDEIIIQFEDWATKELIDGTFSNLGVEAYGEQSGNNRIITTNPFEIPHSIKSIRADREYRFSSREDASRKFNSVLQQLNALPYVAFAEPNYQVEALGEAPNDPYYEYQWNLHHIKAANAWEETKGEGVVVAVIDTGVAYKDSGFKRQAPELSHVSFVKPYNVLNDTTDATDDNGHGTHIAGIIAAGTNNNTGIAGIAPLVSIMPVKSLDSRGYGTYANIAKAIRYAVDNGADILNISLGGTTHSEVLQEAVEYAYEHNVVVIAAAGNDNASSLRYPAAYAKETVSVGSSNLHKQKAEYSNTSADLDLLAPGGLTSKDENNDTHPDGILSQTFKRTYFFVNTSQFGYFYYQGTSVSAPHVAAVAALVKSTGVSDAREIEQILFESTEDVHSPGKDAHSGYGLIRADLAVKGTDGVSEEPQSEDGTAHETPNNEVGDENNEQEAGSEEDTSSTNDPEGEPVEQTEEQTDDSTQDSSENTDNEEPLLPQIEVVAHTYNLWKQIDNNYVFWETAFLGMRALVDGVALSRAETTVEVFNESGVLVARGVGRTDRSGEVWMTLGRHNKGSYRVVIDVVKNGFESAREELEFHFK